MRGGAGGGTRGWERFGKRPALPPSSLRRSRAIRPKQGRGGVLPPSWRRFQPSESSRCGTALLAIRAHLPSPALRAVVLNHSALGLPSFGCSCVMIPSPVCLCVAVAAGHTGPPRGFPNTSPRPASRPGCPGDRTRRDVTAPSCRR